MQDSADRQRDRRFVRDLLFCGDRSLGSCAEWTLDNAKIIKRRRRGGGSGTVWIVGWLAKVLLNHTLVSYALFLKDIKDDRCLRRLTSISLARTRGARPLRRRPPSQRTSSGRGCG